MTTDRDPVEVMTARELHRRLGEYIDAGHGDAAVFAGIDDPAIDEAMQASETSWTPATFDLTTADVTGRGAPMLVIGHAAYNYPSKGTDHVE